MVLGSSSWHRPYRQKKWTLLTEFRFWTRPFAFHIALIPCEFLESRIFLLYHLPWQYYHCQGKWYRSKILNLNQLLISEGMGSAWIFLFKQFLDSQKQVTGVRCFKSSKICLINKKIKLKLQYFISCLNQDNICSFNCLRFYEYLVMF